MKWQIQMPLAVAKNRCKASRKTDANASRKTDANTSPKTDAKRHPELVSGSLSGSLSVSFSGSFLGCVFDSFLSCRHPELVSGSAFVIEQQMLKQVQHDELATLQINNNGILFAVVKNRCKASRKTDANASPKTDAKRRPKLTRSVTQN
ncbi:MAG: hypothetical protein LBO62_03825 [Endomicrobium sp.]|nr:hypothetical protein [Endomicrobium sp.]